MNICIVFVFVVLVFVLSVFGHAVVDYVCVCVLFVSLLQLSFIFMFIDRFLFFVYSFFLAPRAHTPNPCQRAT